MSGVIGRTRASVDLRETPQKNGEVVEGLGADLAVEVLEEQGAWLKVKATGWRGAVEGFAPKLAIAIPKDGPPVFPFLPAQSTEPPLPAVPRNLMGQELAAWLAAGGKPGWIPEEAWNQLAPQDQQAVTDGIRLALQQRQAEWDAWLAETAVNQRQSEATVDEWLAILEGGKDLWTVRPERVFKEPSLSGTVLGWIGTDDILLWSGRLRKNPAEPKQKLWHQVSIYKLGKELKGLYRADLLEEYTFPSHDNDPDIESNASKVFDLSQARLRHPADPEIAEALAAGATAAQYLDLKAVLGHKKRHYNLCGEFCVAALVSVDVIPMLQQWLPTYPRALNILKNNLGTGLPDLQSILRLFGMTSAMFQYASSTASISPKRVKEEISKGKLAIAGVGINRRGKLDAKGQIRHWVVVEDSLPVGNSGWVRLYNPFMNQEEVYNYKTFLASLGQFGIGLWVDMPNK
jgi:hypothetical protein